MSDRFDRLAIEPQVVVAVAQVRRVAFHHVAQKAVEVLEAAFIGRVRRFEAQVPLADDAGAVAGFSQLVGQRRHRGIEVTPRVVRQGANDARDADAIGVAAGEQRGPRRRANGAIGPHRGEEHAFVRDAVDVGRFDVGRMISRDITVPVVIGQDHEEIRPRGSGAGRGQSDRECEQDDSL